MEQNQIERFERNQEIIIDGIHKLLALFTLEPVNDATNPILNLSEAAKLLGVSIGNLSKACDEKEVPHRRLGSKYLFSRVALTAWLHNVNMSYLFEKLENHKKYNKDMYDYDTTEYLENWIRFTINPISGANEEFHLRFNEQAEEEEAKLLDVKRASEFLGVAEGKLRDWAHAFLYYKTPVTRRGNKFFFKEEELIEWMKLPSTKKLMDEYIKNRTRNEHRYKAAEARKESERLEKEERKRQRMMKKQ